MKLNSIQEELWIQKLGRFVVKKSVMNFYAQFKCESDSITNSFQIITFYKTISSQNKSYFLIVMYNYTNIFSAIFISTVGTQAFGKPG